MNASKETIETYLQYCLFRRRLDNKTIRAYRSDLNDFINFMQNHHADILDKKVIGQYVDSLHGKKAPRTVRRKIASLQAFYHYLVYEEIIPENPLLRLDLSFKLPQQLPRYIPDHVLRSFYQSLYQQKELAKTLYQQKCAVRNIAMVELLFATGLRISELCSLTLQAVNLTETYIRVHGKGDRERIIQLTEPATITALQEYADTFSTEICKSGYFFVNGNGRPLSDQSARNIINKITDKAQIPLHITPHMFRHSFATSLVNQDVDIRCIQELLGHSSIKTTEIYTHVNITKQKRILEMKNPRKMLE